MTSTATSRARAFASSVLQAIRAGNHDGLPFTTVEEINGDQTVLIATWQQPRYRTDATVEGRRVRDLREAAPARTSLRIGDTVVWVTALAAAGGTKVRLVGFDGFGPPAKEREVTIGQVADENSPAEIPVHRSVIMDVLAGLTDAEFQTLAQPIQFAWEIGMAHLVANEKIAPDRSCLYGVEVRSGSVMADVYRLGLRALADPALGEAIDAGLREGRHPWVSVLEHHGAPVLSTLEMFRDALASRVVQARPSEVAENKIAEA